MPTIYAHYNFGNLTVHHLSLAQREIVEGHRDCFDLGLQGPDFFFHYLLYRSNEPVKFGQDLHHMTFAEILEKIVEGRVEEARRVGRTLMSRRDAFRPRELAYLYGFAGHHTLDAAAHPYVHAEAGDDSALHFLIETDFDEAILREQGIDPWTYKYTDALPTTTEVQDAVVAIYSPWHDRVSPKQLKASVKSMRRLRAILYTPTERRARFISGAMNKLGFGDKFGTMLMVPGKEAPDQISQARTDELFRCYERAIQDYPQVLNDVDVVIEGGEPSELLKRDFN